MGWELFRRAGRGKGRGEGENVGKRGGRGRMWDERFDLIRETSILIEWGRPVCRDRKVRGVTNPIGGNGREMLDLVYWRVWICSETVRTCNR